MNSNLIKSFEILVMDYRKQKDKLKKDGKDKEASSIQFKINSFNSTLKILKSIDFKITDGNMLKDIKGIGKGVINRINEILKEGSLKELQNTNVTNNTLSKESNLQRITGIGPAKSKKLLIEGITLVKLQNGSINPEDYLTHHQLIGLKYLEDIEKRIPYDEISRMEIYLKNVTQKIDPKLELLICGSYRRKKKTSGDIDILLYSSKKNTDFLKKTVDRLTKQKFLIDHLTNDGETKYMGICQYKLGIPRRIDIRYIKKEHLPTSMLYFTGSGDFNKNMRVYANKRGYKLNEYGLFKMKANKSVGLRINLKTEKEIFEFLDLEYVEPENRIPEYKF